MRTGIPAMCELERAFLVAYSKAECMNLGLIILEMIMRREFRWVLLSGQRYSMEMSVVRRLLL